MLEVADLESSAFARGWSGEDRASCPSFGPFLAPNPYQ